MNPLTIVIFGASGDLTVRKLIPALFGAALKGRKRQDVRIVGMSRSPMSDDQFREHLAPAAKAGRWPRVERIDVE